MKKLLNKIMMAATIAVMTLGMSLVSFAGEWQWLDPDENGIAECYYIDDDGTILTDTVTPDGYTVNELGQWVSGGTVMLKAMGGINENFDTYARLAEEYSGSTGTDINVSPSAGTGNNAVEGTYYDIHVITTSLGKVIQDRDIDPSKVDPVTVTVIDDNTIKIKDITSEYTYIKDENGNYVYSNSGLSYRLIVTFNDDGTFTRDNYSWFGENHSIGTYSKNVNQ